MFGQEFVLHDDTQTQFVKMYDNVTLPCPHNNEVCPDGFYISFTKPDC